MNDQRDPHHSERGQMLALFAIVLIGLMWLMGLGIDAAQLFTSHRHMQSVADLATLAGARSLGEGTSDASSRACAIIIENGYTCPGQTTVTFPAPAQIQVDLAAPVNTWFLRVFGTNTMDAHVRAVAMSVPSVASSGYAIFAGNAGCSSSPELTLDWSGSTNNVIGAVHSDGGIKLGGSSNTVTGPTTYVCPPFSTGSNSLTPAATTTTDQPYPIPPAGYNFSVPSSPDFPCTFTDTSGDMELTSSTYRQSPGVLKPGVYCATSTNSLIKLGSTMSGNVTLISRGKIDISASSSNLTPYLNNVLMYAAQTGDAVIKVAGSNMTWAGYVYAPNGQIEYSGSTNTTLNGSIIGRKVKLNGSSLTIDASSLSGPASPAVIRLVE